MRATVGYVVHIQGERREMLSSSTDFFVEFDTREEAWKYFTDHNNIREWYEDWLVWGRSIDPYLTTATVRFIDSRGQCKYGYVMFMIADKDLPDYCRGRGCQLDTVLAERDQVRQSITAPWRE
jgi:hypothetical protein